eukprot:CAMPEP_0174955676 /NCGR_PEP_ID=MMETSP0004_2-20121128/1112_1 /TAXON_ID=420556 /ORGANISM="Ochromonas sp., Strain CCMP1393" /LENGTH=322 /DNA_ID=CAMNT_0016203627 /DNA_START=183 /DNA_END=1151 /DNA_ORIENTATION=-
MGFFIAGVGDVACQQYEHKNGLSPNRQKTAPKTDSNADVMVPVTASVTTPGQHTASTGANEELSWDKRRTIEMGAIRALVMTPLSQWWFITLQRIFPFGTAITMAGHAYHVFGKVAADQLILMPFMITLVFFTRATIKGDPMQAVDSMRQNFTASWWAGLHYWPLVHTINFGLIPLRYQPMYVSFASLYWNAVLSHYANKNTVQEGSMDEYPSMPATATTAGSVVTITAKTATAATNEDTGTGVRGIDATHSLLEGSSIDGNSSNVAMAVSSQPATSITGNTIGANAASSTSTGTGTPDSILATASAPEPTATVESTTVEKL